MVVVGFYLPIHIHLYLSLRRLHCQIIQSRMSAPHVVIVTGAAGGIGKEIVRHLIENHGANVVATDIIEGSLGSQKTMYGERLVIVTGNIVDVR